MFKVYWTGPAVRVNPETYETVDAGYDMIASKEFEADKMSDALKFMEELRKDERNSFVVMASENPNSVGKPGVDEVGPDYNWTKRRGNMPGLKK